MDPEKKFFGAWWVWIVTLMLGTFVVFGVLNAFGIIGRTVVEREVFERSFQYDQARESQGNIYTAQIAELEAQLQNPNLDAAAKANIEAQLAAIRVRARAADAQRR